MSHLIRLRVIGAATLLGLAGLVAVGGPAQAVPTDPRPVAIGAAWLEDQLTDGLIHNPNYGGFDDYGLTIDTGLSLAAVGGHDAAVSAIATALGATVADHYAQGDEYDANPPYAFVQRGYYAGPTAKALVFAQATGQDPTTWAGVDLVAAVEARVIGTGAATGRLADDSSYGDYVNVIGQAFAARGLSAAASVKADEVVSYLLDQQCADGYFRLNLTTDKGAADQTCDGGVAGGDSSPDTDATALAALQLKAIASPGQAVADAIARAEAWLLAAQHADGSFGGGPSTEAANTNSTGLAGWALGTLGDDAAASRAAVWVRAHQADEPSTCTDALSGETGAIGYDDAGVAAGLSDGITAGTQDQWRRSTAPTLPVLQWAPSATTSLAVGGPAGYVKAGSVATFHVSGAAPGSVVCTSGIGSGRRLVVPASGSASYALTMPAGTADRVATATVRAGSTASVVVPVLGPTTLTVRPARHTVHRRARLHVVIRGLAPGERVVLRLRGVTVRTGHATPAGRFVRDIRVGRRLGRARIVVRGEFPAVRHGRAVIRVVR
jgi:hypothetical protein